MKDFFEVTRDVVGELNKTEQVLFDYVVKNMAEVKQMSIQRFAEERFMSTTSIFRFAKKLGFSGYSDFINSLLLTSHLEEQVKVPPTLQKNNYREEYLKNNIETMRVMSDFEIEKVLGILRSRPDIYILTDDNTQTITQYVEKLFVGLGFHAYGPESLYQRQNLVNRILEKDMIIALSYSGNDSGMNDFIQRLFQKEKPFLLSITRADNNHLASLSDAHFYIFAEELKLNGMDMTSSVSMLMILEVLIYLHLSHSQKKD